MAVFKVKVTINSKGSITLLTYENETIGPLTATHDSTRRARTRAYTELLYLVACPPDEVRPPFFHSRTSPSSSYEPLCSVASVIFNLDSRAISRLSLARTADPTPPLRRISILLRAFLHPRACFSPTLLVFSDGVRCGKRPKITTLPGWSQPGRSFPSVCVREVAI